VFQRLFAPPIAPRSSRRPKGSRLVEQSLGRPVEAEHQFEAAIGVGRDQFDSLPVINSLNAIYEPQTHITFRRAPGSRFRVAGLASQDPKVGVVFAKGRRTDDWNKITSHRTGAVLNVFFVGAMSLDDAQFSDSAVALSQVFGTANFVRRDICVQDDLRGNSFEITVAHECGHSFGALDNTTDGSLMRTPGPGKTISDQEAASMNSSLTSAPP
jgi:hypothetical protein